MKTICLLISSVQNYTLMSKLAKDFYYSACRVICLCDTTNPELIKKIQSHSYKGLFEVILVNQAEIDEFFLQKYHEQQLQNTIDNCLKKFSAAELPTKASVKVFAKLHAGNYLFFTHLLERLTPSCLVVTEDGITGNLWLINAAKKIGIPILNTPYAFGTRQDLEKALRDKEQADEVIYAEDKYAQYLRDKCPQWLKKGKFQDAIIWPAEYIITAEILGITLDDAWRIQGGVSDKLAAESKQMYEHYESEGIDTKRLALTGTVYSDLMFEIIYSEPNLQFAYEHLSKIEFQKEITRVLLSFPPSYHESPTNSCDYATYEELASGLFSALKSIPSCHITVSIHPAAPKHIAELARDLGLYVSTESVFQLIPKHDIYIADYSSTFRSAIVAAKPVINYDFYRFRTCEYTSVEGVMTVETISEFTKIYSRLVTDQQFYRQKAAAQRQAASYFGCLDGQSFNRIESLINSMIHNTIEKQVVIEYGGAHSDER